MKRYRLTINERTYDVQIEDVRATPIFVTVDGEPFHVTWERTAEAAPMPRIDKLAAPPADANRLADRLAPGGFDERAVNAPMPGTILEVCAGVGQSVRRGDELCVLEAMKMKNSIKSPRDGVIAEALVDGGQRVAFGDRLFLFE